MADKAKILENAQTYMAKGQLDKAIEEWQKLISESPNDGNIYNTIGDLLFKKNDLPKAIETYLKGAGVFHAAGFSLKTIAIYKKLIKLVPQRLDIRIKLGDLNAERGLTGNAIEDYLTAAKQYSQEGNVKEALEVYRKIADLDPSNTAIRMKLADLCLKEGLQQQAIGEFLKVAESYFQANQSKEAEVLCERILKLDPKNETARKLMGRPAVSQETPSKPEPLSKEQLLSQIGGAIEKGLLAEARDLLSQFMEQNPDDPVGPYKLGTVLLKTGRKDEAFDQFKKAADHYVGRSEYGQAGKLLKDYLETDPDRIEAHLKLAEVYERGSNLSLAVSVYAHVIDDSLASGETALAKDLYAKIKTLEPQHRDVRRLRYTFETAEISRPRIVPPETDRLPGAAVPSPVEPAPMADPAALHCLFTEAEVYLKYGLSVKAIEQLEQVLAMDPENETAHQQLKDIYKSEGQTAKAVDECLRLIEIYKKTGDPERRMAVLEEAKGLDPENPRIREATDRTPIVESGRTEISSGSLQGKEDVSEQMAEADFYDQQGLRDEAGKIHELILTPRQDPPASIEKLEALETEEALEEEMKAQKEAPASIQKPKLPQPAEVKSTDEQRLDEELEKSFAPFMSGDSVSKELDDIFSEFHKDAEQVADSIDYETHYNLGIAYKEMGLLTEAMVEFKQAMNGPDRFIDASHMLAACHRDNGNNQDAIEFLERALSDSRCNEAQGLWLRYDLASLYEKESRLEKALALFNEIARLDRNFKDVVQRVENLEGLLGKPKQKTQAIKETGEEEEDVDAMMERILGESLPGTKTKKAKTGASSKADAKKRDRISYL
ncbi:MAG: tetratricopeptide repeat protein [Nitrospirota bacterium]